MGTTNRSVNKNEGKVPETVTVKAEKQNVKRTLSLSAVMAELGMNYHRSGKSSKDPDILRANKPGHKKNKKRQQNKARATQARVNKTW